MVKGEMAVETVEAAVVAVAVVFGVFQREGQGGEGMGEDGITEGQRWREATLARRRWCRRRRWRRRREGRLPAVQGGRRGGQWC